LSGNETSSSLDRSTRDSADSRSGVSVLMVTSEWPTPENPLAVPFLVQQVDFLRRAGAEVEVFFFRGAKNPINYLKAWWRFNRKYPRRSQFDVVHAQFGQASLIALPKRWPLIITFHGTDLLGQLSPDGNMTWQGRLLIWLGRTAARFADAVLIVSSAMKRNLPAGMPVLIHPTGVDLEAIPNLTPNEARLELGLPLNERLALFVGSPHNPLKRYPLAQRAVEELDKRLPTTLVLGWGKPHGDIIKMMLACDVLVVTSAQEGSPTIFKEALACNLPIVSVVVGDAVERFGNVEGCEIVTDNRAESIAVAMERVLRRGGRIEGRRVIADLDERLMAKRLMEIYCSALSNAGTRGAHRQIGENDLRGDLKERQSQT
jgi:teichuronic acid biosynthesis glycosyltransferase TuaC